MHFIASRSKLQKMWRMNNLNIYILLWDKNEMIYLHVCTANKLGEIYYDIMHQPLRFRENRLIKVLFHLLPLLLPDLFLLIIAAFITAGVFIEADGRLYRIAA